MLVSYNKNIIYFCCPKVHPHDTNEHLLLLSILNSNITNDMHLGSINNDYSCTLLDIHLPTWRVVNIVIMKQIPRNPNPKYYFLSDPTLISNRYVKIVSKSNGHCCKSTQKLPPNRSGPWTTVLRAKAGVLSGGVKWFDDLCSRNKVAKRRCETA